MLTGRDEVLRRRGLVPHGRIVEVWPDHHANEILWTSEESKTLLDSVGEPLAATLTLEAAHVALYYGPRLCDLESLPSEDSVKARALSAHAVAVAWITIDRFGERTTYQPQSFTDPVFYLRRVGGGASHVWRTFATRAEAVAYMRESYGGADDAQSWAAALPDDDFDQMITRHAVRGGRR